MEYTLRKLINDLEEYIKDGFGDIDIKVMIQNKENKYLRSIWSIINMPLDRDTKDESLSDSFVLCSDKVDDAKVDSSSISKLVKELKKYSDWFDKRVIIAIDDLKLIVPVRTVIKLNNKKNGKEYIILTNIELKDNDKEE